jgi:hypothetical protein
MPDLKNDAAELTQAVKRQPEIDSFENPIKAICIRV